MGKRLAALLSAVGLTLAVGIGTALPASADGTPGCLDAYTPGGAFAVHVCFDEVQSSSGNDNLRFHGQVIAPSQPPAQAVILKGFPCYPFDSGQETTDSQMVITPSGALNGYCHYQP